MSASCKPIKRCYSCIQLTTKSATWTLTDLSRACRHEMVVPDRSLPCLQYPAARADVEVRFILTSPDDNVWDRLAYACVEALVAMDTVSMSRGRALWSRPCPCSELETWLAGSHPELLQEADCTYPSLGEFLRQERTCFVVYRNDGGVRLRVRTCVMHMRRWAPPPRSAAALTALRRLRVGYAIMNPPPLPGHIVLCAQCQMARPTVSLRYCCCPAWARGRGYMRP